MLIAIFFSATIVKKTSTKFIRWSLKDSAYRISNQSDVATDKGYCTKSVMMIDLQDQRN